MENIIKKAIEGGYEVKSYCENTSCNNSHALYDPLFWQYLGKAKGWEEFSPFTCGCNDIKKMPGQRRTYLNHAIRFHEINLTEGFDSAVSWLEKLISE